MPALAKILTKTAVDTSIKGLLKKYFKEERENPKLDPKTSFVRASGLAYLCPREEVLTYLLDHKTRSRTTDTATMLTFSHGHGLHYAVQNKVLAGLGILVGSWICLGCGHMHGKPQQNKALIEFLVTRPEVCDQVRDGVKCVSTEFLFHELHFRDDVYRIGGHPDGFLKMAGLPGLGILEVKSISDWGMDEKNQDNALNAPLSEHIIQANIYMWLTRTEWTKFFYWNKSKDNLAGIIEHTIQKDDEIISRIQLMLKGMWAGMETGDLPKRLRKCTSVESKRALKCPMAAVCFSNDDKLVNRPVQ